VTFTVDATLPAAPVVTAPTGGSLTNDNTPTITGTAEANASVAVLVDAGQVGTVSASGTGAWTYTLTAGQALTDGSHTVTARATDGAGNTGPLSAGVTFTVDATAPAAPVILSPTQDEVVLTSTPTITGTAEANATITIVIDAVPNGTTTADGAGAWTYSVSVALAGGSHTVIAGATDAANNTGPDSAVRNFSTP
jgi:VCBS repeat-containing protein